MTYVTKMAEILPGGLLVLFDFVSQDCWVRDYDGASLHFDKSSSVQSSEIPGYEFSNRAKTNGEFFVVLGEFELDPAPRLAPKSLSEAQKVCDQPPTNR